MAERCGRENTLYSSEKLGVLFKSQSTHQYCPREDLLKSWFGGQLGKEVHILWMRYYSIRRTKSEIYDLGLIHAGAFF